MEDELLWTTVVSSVDPLFKVLDDLMWDDARKRVHSC